MKGLIRGASKGDGLGNAFLSHIREVDGIFHVVRAFDDPDIIHTEIHVDPIRFVIIFKFKYLENFISIQKKKKRYGNNFYRISIKRFGDLYS